MACSTNLSGNPPRSSPASHCIRRWTSAPRLTPPKCSSGIHRRRSTSAFAPLSRTARLRRALPTATGSAPTTTSNSTSTPFSSDGARSCSSSTPSACRPTAPRLKVADLFPARTCRRVRPTSARTSCGSRRDISPTTATKWKSGFRSVACAFRSAEASGGDSRSIATCSTTATRKPGLRC